jgi:hypothetical protein
LKTQLLTVLLVFEFWSCIFEFVNSKIAMPKIGCWGGAFGSPLGPVLAFNLYFSSTLQVLCMVDLSDLGASLLIYAYACHISNECNLCRLALCRCCAWWMRSTSTPSVTRQLSR